MYATWQMAEPHRRFRITAEANPTSKESARVPHQTPNTVAILARDAVAGQALVLLLQGSGYDTRFISETAIDELTIDELAEALDGARLLILTPTLSAKRREDFLKSMKSTPATAKIPVLKLIPALNRAQAEQDGHVDGHVLWPCWIEDLEEKIEAALLSGSAR